MWTDGQTDRHDETNSRIFFAHVNSNIIVGRIFGVWKLLPDKLQQPEFTIWPSLNYGLILAVNDYIGDLNAVNHFQRLIDAICAF